LVNAYNSLERETLDGAEAMALLARHGVVVHRKADA
jgi:hypothetical protein